MMSLLAVSPTGFLAHYLTLNLLLLMGGVTALLLASSLSSAQSKLQLHYLTLTIALSAVVVAPLLPRSQLFEPPAKIWAHSSHRPQSKDELATSPAALAIPMQGSSVEFYSIDIICLLVFSLLVSRTVFIMARDLYRLIRLRNASFLVRRIGRVEIRILEDLPTPLSFRFLRRHTVVVPSFLVFKPDLFCIAVWHELQHHRQRDTLWVYILSGLGAICLPNLAFHYWAKRISEIQEFACDETLLGRSKVDAKAYARCLVEVAETAIGRKMSPVSATGFLMPAERKLLHRRIKSMFMFNCKRPARSRKYFYTSCLLMTSIITGTAFAATELITDRRISMSRANEMAAVARQSTTFPIVINEAVLKELNHLVGTPDGRVSMSNALARFESQKAMLTRYFRQYNAPVELAAVPLVESGYENLTEKEGSNGAGIWMFIASTARNYGLRVDQAVDERLNTELETDAAMRYLTSNRLRFSNWLLALLAYNAGEDAVQTQITQSKSRDPWKLLEDGLKTDRRYLPRIMAAVLIMKNPESLR